jgi:outer membrane protein assembly factor BamE (lipoprotein component of BamABCDE complex)
VQCSGLILSSGGSSVTLLATDVSKDFLMTLGRRSRVRFTGGYVLVVLVVLVLWSIWSDHPLRDAALGVLLQEDTEYSSGFSETTFRTIKPGMSESDVKELLGVSFGESWFYTSKARYGCEIVRFDPEDAVIRGVWRDECTQVGLKNGMSVSDVQRLLGQPREACTGYTRSPGDTDYRVRIVCFSNGQVVDVRRHWYFD